MSVAHRAGHSDRDATVINASEAFSCKSRENVKHALRMDCLYTAHRQLLSRKGVGKVLCCVD